MSRGDGKAGLRREVVNNLARALKLSEQSLDLRSVAKEMCSTFNLDYEGLNDRAVKVYEKQGGQGTESSNEEAA